MVEKFGEGREYEEKKKESPKKNAEKKDSETSKQLDKLHADVDIKQQTNAFEHDKNKELSEIKEDMDDLKKAVPMKKISSQESSQPAYEQMSDEQIASVADK